MKKPTIISSKKNYAIEKKPAKFQVAEEPDQEKWKFNPEVAIPANIYSLQDWSQLEGFAWSDSGSGGVFFLGWENNEVVVLKGSVTVMADEFAYKLAKLCNMPVPELKNIRFHFDNAFEQISARMDILDSRKKQSEQGRPRTTLLKPILTLMEYVRGSDLYHVPNVSESFTSSPQILKEIGRLIMFDVLINNWDRLPLIWDNEGNLGNFFITKDPNRILVGIDQSVSSIAKTSPQFKTYIEKVNKVMNELVTIKHGEDTRCLFFIKNCFKNHLNYDLTETQLDLILEGMKQGAKDIGSNLSRKIMEDIYTEMDQRVNDLIKSMSWGVDVNSRYGMTKIDLDFLGAVLEEFKQVLPKLE